MDPSKVTMESKDAASNLLSALHTFYQFGHLCDVTVHTEHLGVQEEFSVHKAVLAASSNYFKEIFLRDELSVKKEATVTLQDIYTEDFTSFLEFVYTTKMEIEPQNVYRMQEIAERLECKDLVEACEHLKMKLSTESTDLKEQVCKEHKLAGKSESNWTKTHSRDLGDQETEMSSKIVAAPMRNRLWDKLPKKKTLENSRSQLDDCVQQGNIKEVFNPIIQADSPETRIVIKKLHCLEDEDGTQDEPEVSDGYELKKINRNASKRMAQNYTCDKCHQTFPFLKPYQVHMTSEHGITIVVKYSCNMCSQLFSNYQNLRQHRLTVHNNERPFVCLLCDKRFKRQKDINDHTRRVHEKKRTPQTCPFCDKVISSKCGLTVHIRTHTGEKPYRCQYCPASFAQRSAYNTHVRSHTGEKPYICEDCGACFTDKAKLNGHKRTHTGERLYGCDVCGKHFATNEYLKCHKRCHMGAKPYKCEACGKTFGLRASLAQHSNIHAETRPYFCEQCGKAFTQQGALRRHQRIHTGEKPYKCKACERTFTDMSTLRRHVSVHDRNAHWRSYLIDLTSKKDHNWSKIETVADICLSDDPVPVSWMSIRNEQPLEGMQPSH